jgi:hypothetical protein
LKEECNAGDQHSFVQAPLSTPDDVRGFINPYTSRRALHLDTIPAFITHASIGLKHNLKRKDSPSLLEVSHMQSPQVEQKMSVSSPSVEYDNVLQPQEMHMQSPEVDLEK